MSLDDLERHIARVPPRRALGLGFALVALFGFVQVAFAGSHGWANLDLEFQPPALYGAALDIGAGILALLLARHHAPELPSLALYGLGALLIFMGIDEIASIHEKSAEAAGVDSWIVLYSPLIIAGGIGWLFVWRGLRRLDAWPMVFAAGAACWVVAQVLERWAYDGLPGIADPIIDPETQTDLEIGQIQESWTYHREMVPEELLELSGSLLFLAALLCALHVLRRRESPR